MKMLLLLMLAVYSFINCQAQAYEGHLLYQKIQQPVAVIELRYPADRVENAINDYMAKKGFKVSSSKGFNVFRATKLDDSDADQSDLYFKIERKSHEKDVTVVSLLPTKVNEDLLTRSLTDTARINEAKTFLNNITPYIDAHNLKAEIDLQYAAVKKAQKKYDGLVSDQSDLEKKIRNLNASLDQNKSDQQKQQAILQYSAQQDDDAARKAHRKMDHLLDDKGSLEKKLRNAQSDLDQNKRDQEDQKLEIQKQQQALDALNAKKKSPGD